jgi:hypothetical protein
MVKLRANIKMGEILKKSKEDKVPSLEVTIELEDGRIDPDTQFLYLYEVEGEHQTSLSLSEDRMYIVERLKMAENLGKSYIRLDFDRSKK